MAAFPSSAHALKHVVAGIGSELALILSLEMAAGDVLEHRRKHATRKPVQVQISLPSCVYAFPSSLCVSDSVF